MLSPRRLPGIRIDATPPPAVEALPRMDVAVLAGFASTGPLHLPVVVESVGQYAAVFGSDAPLAWDAVRGERIHAHLGPAVRAFFANGGRRCWIIRVARSAASEALWRGVEPAVANDLEGIATANRFAVPGVLSVNADGIDAAMAQARCEGSWSDALRVSTALSRQSLAIEALSADGSPASARVSLRTRFGLRTGDLLLLGDPANVCAYAVVGRVTASAAAGGALEVQAVLQAAFERITEADSPPAAGSVQLAGFGPSVPATLPASGRMVLDEPVPARLEAGHWARWSDAASTLWLRIDEIDRSEAAFGSPADPSMMNATLTGPVWRELGAVLPAQLATVQRAQVLTLDLRTARDAVDARLSGVGLTPEHRAAWWAQQTDAEFHRPRDDAQADGSVPTAPSDAPRFPLAAEAPPLAWIPLGVEPLFGPALAPLPQAATALERDGLARFDAELFLDPELALTGIETLLAHADAIRLMRELPRPLLGLHAALSIGSGGLFNEASLLAIPDALHLGWQARGTEAVDIADPQAMPTPPHWRHHRGACACAGPVADPLDAPDFGVFLDCATRLLQSPVLQGPGVPVPPGAYRLSWSEAEPGGEYVLLEATQPDFSDAREVYRGPNTGHEAVTRREGLYYYQVFVMLGGERSDGSNPIAVQVRSDDWVAIAAPELAPEFESHWLTVHRAALRLACASGELFAVLALPRHYRTPQALRYAERLRAVQQPLQPAGEPAFGFNEARALSYGALFHPWLQADLGAPQADRATATVVPFSRRVPRIVPPDGVALGVLAGRAASRGAWIAPANEPMKDVVALAPTVDRGDWQALQDARINLLHADPRGIFTLSADTLSLDTDLRPIGVRRLLILLRRLALRRGTTYVFEPNGPTLRRAVQRSFSELMTGLFRRGAFAGATPQQSFRVVTDDTLNTSRDADAGRFFVELRVAPSLPMRFISVRLAQSGERLTVAEEL